MLYDVKGSDIAQIVGSLVQSNCGSVDDKVVNRLLTFLQA